MQQTARVRFEITIDFLPEASVDIAGRDWPKRTSQPLLGISDGIAMQLDQLLAARADLWRGRGTPQAAPAGLSTGFAALDAALSGHGWPRGGLSEVLTAHQGAGLALLLPLLVALSRQPRWLLWVNPPHLPFAPALAARGLALERLLIVHAGVDAAWASEQGLRSGTCAAVLAWTGPHAGCGAAGSSSMGGAAGSGGHCYGRADRRGAGGWAPAVLRRLQLAAAETNTPALLLRPPAAAGETSPAVLRLRVSARADGLDVTLLKQRGGRPGQRLRLPEQPIPPRREPAAPRQVQAAGGGVLAVGGGRRGRRRRTAPGR
jgi:hypothetical protein